MPRTSVSAAVDELGDPVLRGMFGGTIPTVVLEAEPAALKLDKALPEPTGMGAVPIGAEL